MVNVAMLSEPGFRDGTLDRDTGGFSTSMNFFAALLWRPGALATDGQSPALYFLYRQPPGSVKVRGFPR